MNKNITHGKPTRKRIAIWISMSLIFLLIIGAALLYHNFNRLLSNALMKSFNSTIASQVYELRFKGLNVHFLKGNIRVRDVELFPRAHPAREYPYINSSFRLSTRSILLENVEIVNLIRNNVLKLERIEIAEPEIHLKIADKIPVFIPFQEAEKDSVSSKPKEKKLVESFFLKEFDLTNASFQVDNSARLRNLKVSRVNFSLRDMGMIQQPGKAIVSYSRINLFIGDLTGALQKESVRYIHLKDHHLQVDSLEIRMSPGELNFRFHDIGMGLGRLDMQLADSIFHLTLQSFDLSYSRKSMSLRNLVFLPNIGEKDMQKQFAFQNTQFEGSIGQLTMKGINFDTLFYHRKILMEEIALDSLSAAIFKDKTKPVDPKRFPVYLGQTLTQLKLPLLVKSLQATNVNLVNRERSVKGDYAIAHINRGTVIGENITNISTGMPLKLTAEAFLEEKVQFKVDLSFDYLHPAFRFKGSLASFSLNDLNNLIGSYTPATVKKGVVDEISFSGKADRTSSAGTMKFLYHDLDIDLELKDKAKWKSSVLAFAANAIVASSNPVSDKLPPKVVAYHIERDPHKSFVNVLIKSALAGLKETIILSKENKKAYKEEKKKFKKQN